MHELASSLLYQTYYHFPQGDDFMAHIRIETATTEHTALHAILYADNERQELVAHATIQQHNNVERQVVTPVFAPQITAPQDSPLVEYAYHPEPYQRPTWIEPVVIPDTLPTPHKTSVTKDTEDYAPYLDAEGNICEVCRITEARIDLKKSHAFLSAGALLHALGEHFFHLHFAETDDGILFDAYANDCFVVTYCLNTHGKDQLRVRWIDPDAEEAHTEYELPDMARQIARLLGGGTNLRLLDSMVRCTRLSVPDVVV
jgi:hypothetical protein